MMSSSTSSGSSTPGGGGGGGSGGNLKGKGKVLASTTTIPGGVGGGGQGPTLVTTGVKSDHQQHHHPLQQPIIIVSQSQLLQSSSGSGSGGSSGISSGPTQIVGGGLERLTVGGLTRVIGSPSLLTSATPVLSSSVVRPIRTFGGIKGTSVGLGGGTTSGSSIISVGARVGGGGSGSSGGGGGPGSVTGGLTILTSRTPTVGLLGTSTAGLLNPGSIGGVGGGSGGNATVSVSTGTLSTLHFQKGAIIRTGSPTLQAHPGSITVTPISASGFGPSLRLAGTTMSNGSWIQTNTSGFTPLRPNTIQVSRGVRHDGKLIQISGPAPGTMQQVHVVDSKGTTVLKPGGTPITVRGGTPGTAITLPLAPFAFRTATPLQVGTAIPRAQGSVSTISTGHVQKVLTQTAHGPPPPIQIIQSPRTPNTQGPRLQGVTTIPRLNPPLCVPITAANGKGAVSTSGASMSTTFSVQPRQSLSYGTTQISTTPIHNTTVTKVYTRDQGQNNPTGEQTMNSPGQPSFSQRIGGQMTSGVTFSLGGSHHPILATPLQTIHSAGGTQILHVQHNPASGGNSNLPTSSSATTTFTPTGYILDQKHMSVNLIPTGSSHGGLRPIAITSSVPESKGKTSIDSGQVKLLSSGSLSSMSSGGTHNFTQSVMSHPSISTPHQQHIHTQPHLGSTGSILPHATTSMFNPQTSSGLGSSTPGSTTSLSHIGTYQGVNSSVITVSSNISTTSSNTITSSASLLVTQSNTPTSLAAPGLSSPSTKSTLSPRPSILRKREAMTVSTLGSGDQPSPFRANRNLATNFGVCPVSTTSSGPVISISSNPGSGVIQAPTLGAANNVLGGTSSSGGMISMAPYMLRKEFLPPTEESWHSCSSNSSSGSTTVSATSETADLQGVSMEMGNLPGSVNSTGITNITNSASHASTMSSLGNQSSGIGLSSSTSTLPQIQIPHNGISVKLGAPAGRHRVTSISKAASKEGQGGKSKDDGVTPRKKPRMEQLQPNDGLDALSPEISFYQGKRLKRNEIMDPSIFQGFASNTEKERDEHVVEVEEEPQKYMYFLKKPYKNMFSTCSNSTLTNPKLNHFERYSDVKSKEERRPTIHDLANQRNAFAKLQGVKIHRLAGAMDDIVSMEKGVISEFSELLEILETDTNLESDSPVSRDFNRVQELLKGNIQRSKVISDQMSDSRSQAIKILDHKLPIANLMQKFVSKRPIKKRDRLGL